MHKFWNKKKILEHHFLKRHFEGCLSKPLNVLESRTLLSTHLSWYVTDTKWFNLFRHQVIQNIVRGQERPRAQTKGSFIKISSTEEGKKPRTDTCSHFGSWTQFSMSLTKTVNWRPAEDHVLISQNWSSHLPRFHISWSQNSSTYQCSINI